jgi:hypothetical protein
MSFTGRGYPYFTLAKRTVDDAAFIKGWPTTCTVNPPSRSSRGVTLKERCEWLRKSCQYRWLVVHNHRLRVLLGAYAIGHLCPRHIGLHQAAP